MLLYCKATHGLVSSKTFSTKQMFSFLSQCCAAFTVQLPLWKYGTKTVKEKSLFSVFCNDSFTQANYSVFSFYHQELKTSPLHFSTRRAAAS